MREKIKTGVTIFLLFFFIGMMGQSYAEVNDNKSRKTNCRSGGGTVSNVSAATFVCTLSGDTGTASVSCSEGSRCVCTGSGCGEFGGPDAIERRQPPKGVRTPFGSSNLLEKRQPRKGPSAIIGPKETRKQGNMVRVPRLLGMSRANVEKTLKKIGLRPEFTGRGTVVKGQRPGPGTRLPKGGKVKVNLSTPATRIGPATVGPRVVQPGSGSPGVMLSSITVSCASGSTFELKTGTDKGECQTSQDDDGNVTGGLCGDTLGNAASVDCTANGGAGSCLGSFGSGDCKPVR